MKYPDPSLPWPFALAAVNMIAEKEQGPKGGAALKAYLCPAKVWTIGWGRTEGVRQGMTCTEEQADAWLCDALTERAGAVEAVCTVAPNANQLAALVSLQYNIGHGALRTSTVLKRHNASDFDAAARAFALWNKAKVRGQLQVMPGLTSRRAAEAALYLRPEDDDPQPRMPQAVVPESSLAASPIVRIGAGAAGTGALTAVSNSSDQVGIVGGLLAQAKTIAVGTLGIPDGWFLPAMLVAAGGGVIYWRWKQRQSGWV